MTREVIVGFLLMLPLPVAAQTGSWPSWVGVSAAMGISAMTAPGTIDYMNAVGQATSAERVSEFTSITDFTITPEIRILEEWSAGVEYSYRVTTFTVNSSGGRSQFDYSAHHGGIVAHYLIEGRGSLVRLGGGVSAVLGKFSQALFGSSVFSDFQASGGSIKLEAIGDTAFDDHLSGTIGGNMLWVFGGPFHRGAQQAAAGQRKAGLSSFSFGLKLGVTVRL